MDAGGVQRSGVFVPSGRDPMRRRPIVSACLVGALGALALGGYLYTRRPLFLPDITRAQRAPDRCPDTSTPDYYFPAGLMFPHKPEYDESERELYSLYLRRMEAASLACGVERGESYRVVALYPPLMVQITRDGGRPVLRGIELKEFTQLGQPGPVTRRIDRELTEGEWQRATDALARAEFWRSPVREGRCEFCWILEGRRGHGYHLVLRSYGDYEQAFLTLLGLAGIKDPTR